LRLTVLLIALAFTLVLAAATVVSFAKDGVTGLGVLSAFIVVLLGIAFVGAIRQPPRQ
jgi:hypothetical protein